MDRPTYNLKGACEYLHIGETSLRLLVDNLELSCARVGREYVFRKEVLDAYLMKLEREQEDQRITAIEIGKKARVHSAVSPLRSKRRTPPQLPLAA